MDVTAAELRSLIQRASALKAMLRAGTPHETLKNKVLAMVFEKSSTRTRVAFEVAMAHLGGSAVFLSPRDTQLGRGEPVEDSARVLSRMVDAVTIRTFAHSTLEQFAAHCTVPVINALTDLHHPCQLLADMQTFFELHGAIQGHEVAWIGDGNNMCNSYIHAARQLDFRLRIACPHGYEPDAALLAESGDHIVLMRDPLQAADGAMLVVTDVWTSMGQEPQQAERMRDLANFQVNAKVMAAAQPEAIFMHCLPAHREEEVTTAVIDGPQSVVWDEAENRLHAQKALLEFLCRAEKR